jgi:stalled ribosome rescue protein Dom34
VVRALLSIDAMTVHAAVWLDHEHAKIFFFPGDTFDEEDFRAPKHQLASRVKGLDNHRRESRDQKEYFETIAKSLADAEEILVMGPGTAKIQFLKHAHKHEPKLEERIVGIETADHPTPGQIVAHARQYFRAKDRMLGSSSSGE